jgi:hypothetical protein
VLSGCGQIPGAALASIALNVKSAGLTSFIFLVCEIFIWTYTSPISESPVPRTKSGHDMITEPLPLVDHSGIGSLDHLSHRDHSMIVILCPLQTPELTLPLPSCVAQASSR